MSNVYSIRVDDQGKLPLVMSDPLPEDLDLVLTLGNDEFRSGAVDNTPSTGYVWNNSGLSCSDGQQIEAQLSLYTDAPAPGSFWPDLFGSPPGTTPGRTSSRPPRRARGVLRVPEPGDRWLGRGPHRRAGGQALLGVGTRRVGIRLRLAPRQIGLKLRQQI